MKTEQQSTSSGIDRRDLLKATGAAAGAALLQACARREVAYIEQPLQRRGLPGASVWRQGVCTQCAAACGLSVRTVDGDAKKVEGDPEHPISRGGVCAIGQTLVQQLYDPLRITQPLRRLAPRGVLAGADPLGEGSFEAASWEQALEAIGAQIASARAAEGQRIQVLSRRDGFAESVWARFAQAMGAAPIALWESWPTLTERRAAQAVFGRATLPVTRFDDVDLILSLGAAFLDRWHSPVHYARAYVDWRSARIRGRFFHVEPRMGLTAAKADRWLPARPGSEGVLARALGGALLATGKPSAAGAARYRDLFPGAAPSLEDAARLCDIAPERLEELLRELVEAERVAILAGDAITWGRDGLSATTAAMALSLLIGDVEIDRSGVVTQAAGGTVLTPSAEGLTHQIAPDAPAPVDALAGWRRALDGEVGLLLVSECDPLYGMPKAWAEEALAKTDALVVVADTFDDTTRAADWILPAQADLERLAVAAALPSNDGLVVSIASPAVRPLGTSRHPVDIALALTATQQALAVDLPWADVEGVLRHALGDDAARDGLRSGVARLAFEAPVEGARGIQEATLGDVIAEPQAPQPAAVPATEPTLGSGLTVVPFASVRAGEDGRAADREWLRELPDPMASVQWDAWVEVSSRDAEALRLRTGDRVRLRAAESGGVFEAAVFASPTVRPGTVSIPFGFGHLGRGPARYQAASRRSNAFDLIGEERVDGVGSPALGAVTVRLEKVDGPPVPVYGRGLREAEEIPRGWGAHRPERRQRASEVRRAEERAEEHAEEE